MSIDIIITNNSIDKFQSEQDICEPMLTSITPKIQRKLASKELYIGKRIAPKVIRTNKIDENGKLIDKVAVNRKMIPILKILEADSS